MNAILYLYAIKCKSNLFNEMHINAMMNKDIGVIIMHFQSVIMMIISVAYFFCGHSILFNPFCAKLFQHDQQKRFDSFQFCTNLIDVIFCGILNCWIPIADNWKITMINYLRFICIQNKYVIIFCKFQAHSSSAKRQ